MGAAVCFLGPDFGTTLRMDDPTPLEGGKFGRSVTVADFDNDGFGDVAIASSAELCSDFLRCGEAQVFFGPDLVRHHRIPIPFDDGSSANLTHTVASGDFNDDQIDDLVLSTWSEVVQGYSSIGVLRIFLGPDLRLGWKVPPVAVNLSDIAGFFGYRLATGDVNGDGLDDLVAGEPFRNGGRGAVHVFYFSTQFPFRSYGIQSSHFPTLTGAGAGVPDGQSVLEIRGLSGSPASLLVGRRASSQPLFQTDAFANAPRLLLVPERWIDLGSGLSDLDYPLILPKDMDLENERFRFQVLEISPGSVRATNGVVWTVRR